MRLRIYNIDGKYAFSLNGFSSLKHSNLIPEVEPTYNAAWKALSAGKEIHKNKPHHVEALKQKKFAYEDLTKPMVEDVSAEETLIGHYDLMLDEMSQKVLGIDDNGPEEVELTYQVLKSQVEDLLRLKDELEEGEQAKIKGLIDGYRSIAREHFQSQLNRDKKKSKEEAAAPAAPNMPPMDGMEGGPPMPPGAPTGDNMTMASKKRITLTEDEALELFEHYGNKICESLQHHHPDAIPRTSFKDGCIKIVSLNKGEEILNIKVNDNFNVSNIVPSGELSEIFPSYSPKFYQRYWKPIVEAVGHFFLDDLDALILPKMSALPDMPDEGCQCCNIRSWNPNELKEIPVSLSFNQEAPIWLISKAEDTIRVAQNQALSEDDLLANQPSRVRCIDQALEIFGSIGEVVQVIPINEGVGLEVDVNFGRKVMRLSRDQIEVVNEI